MNMEETLTKMNALLGEGLVDVRYGEKFSVAGTLQIDGQGNYSVIGYPIPLDRVDSITTTDDSWIRSTLIRVRDSFLFSSGAGV